MGIQSFKVLAKGDIFSSNNLLYRNLGQQQPIIRYKDIEQLSSKEFGYCAFKNSEKLIEQYVKREIVQSYSGSDFDSINEYIYFLKNNAISIDTTNLYIPHQIREKERGLCQAIQIKQLYYPLYEYRMRPQVEARHNRNQSFHESELWYLVYCVINAMRQFEKIKQVSSQFSIDSIRFNSLGCIKIQNIMTSPQIFNHLKNDRLYWSYKNLTYFFIQETYRLGILLLDLASMSSLSSILQQIQFRNDSNLRGIDPNIRLQHQIQKSFEVARRKYSELLLNLVKVMICHPRDRPLPSQIYQVLSPYKNQIMQFKPFTFNFGPHSNSLVQGSFSQSRASGGISGSTGGNLIGSNNNLDGFVDNLQHQSFQLPMKNMYSSLKNSLSLQNRQINFKNHNLTSPLKESSEILKRKQIKLFQSTKPENLTRQHPSNSRMNEDSRQKIKFRKDERTFSYTKINSVPQIKAYQQNPVQISIPPLPGSGRTKDTHTNILIQDQRTPLKIHFRSGNQRSFSIQNIPKERLERSLDRRFENKHTHHDRSMNNIQKKYEEYKQKERQIVYGKDQVSHTYRLVTNGQEENKRNKMMSSKSVATFSKGKQERGLNFKRPNIMKQNPKPKDYNIRKRNEQ